MSDAQRNWSQRAGRQGICDEGQITQDPAFTYLLALATKQELGPGGYVSQPPSKQSSSCHSDFSGWRTPARSLDLCRGLGDLLKGKSGCPEPARWMGVAAACCLSAHCFMPPFLLRLTAAVEHCVRRNVSGSSTLGACIHPD